MHPKRSSVFLTRSSRRSTDSTKAPGGIPGLFPIIAAPFRSSTTFSPTTSRCQASTETDDLIEGALVFLKHGVSCVAATRGADRAVVVAADGVREFPAFAVDVVDTSGWGDATELGEVLVGKRRIHQTSRSGVGRAAPVIGVRGAPAWTHANGRRAGRASSLPSSSS